MEDANPAPEFLLNVFGWPWTGAVTLLTLLVYFIFSYQVGRARMIYGVKAPETSGPPEFLCALRVQLNTLEQMVIFLPLLWMAALCSDTVAAGIGIFWPLSRLAFAVGYRSAEPKNRFPGFLGGVLVVVLLFLFVAVQVVRGFLIWE